MNAALMRKSIDETAAKEIQTIEAMDETAVKDIQIPHINGLRVVGATPGHSIVILVYCKTTDNLVTFTQVFNSGELQTKLENILNRLFARIEPKSTEILKSSIRLDDEDILEIEDITGIEGQFPFSFRIPTLYSLFKCNSSHVFLATFSFSGWQVRLNIKVGQIIGGEFDACPSRHFSCHPHST